MTYLLATRSIAKPWGRTALPESFASTGGEPIGEIWFEPPQELDSVLVKYLFSSEKLSVQVHPPGIAGKDECWLVVDVDEGAELAIGFSRPVGPAEMRQAALDGSIEQLLAWHRPKVGDFFYIPAGTVHAIGAGVSLVEVQQNRDVTYRLYDYGRPRDLHLDQAVAVANGTTHDPALRRALPDHGSIALVSGPYFRLDRLEGSPDAALAMRYKGPLLVIPLSSGISVYGDGVAPGQCAQAPSLGALAIVENAQCLLAQPC